MRTSGHEWRTIGRIDITLCCSHRVFAKSDKMNSSSDREKPLGWEGELAPKDLPGLEQYLTRALESFRKMPETPGYQRVVSQFDRGSVKIVTTEPNPRYVRTQVQMGRRAIRNAHRWLEHHRIDPLPDWEPETDSVDEAERQLSGLLRFLRGAVAAANHSQVDKVTGGGMQRKGSEKAKGRIEEDFREAASVLASALNEYVDSLIPQSSSGNGGDDSMDIAIRGGHPVHTSVVRLEAFFDRRILPPDGRLKWRRLLKRSRAERQREEEIEKAAIEFRDWVESLLFRDHLARKAGVHTSAKRKPKSAAPSTAPRDIVISDRTGPPRDDANKPKAKAELLGNGRYKVGDLEIRITDSENVVLETLIQFGPLNSTELADKSGYNHAARILRRLRTKYDGLLAPFIHCPGGKSKGGYNTSLKEV